ncbi:MAG: glycosyltransferase family 39 protein [Candidatus Omnitrophota bacterium]
MARYSLWFDEAASVLSADYMHEMISKMGMLEERYPSFLSNQFIYYWQRLGKDEFTLRMSAVIFGMLAVLVIYRVAKHVFSRKAGIIAAFILAVSPIHIYYSREVRVYSLEILTVLVSVYFLIKALESDRMRYWSGYLAFSLASIYLHYMNIFILFSGIIFVLIYYRKCRCLFKRWLAVNAVLFIFLLPWMINTAYLVKTMFYSSQKHYWVLWWAGHSFKNILYTFKNFSAGYNTNAAIYIPLTAIFLIFFSAGLRSKRGSKSGVLFLLCFLIPIFSMYMISKISPWYVDRYVLPSSIFYYLLVANGISKMSNRRILAALCIITALLSFGTVNYYKDIIPERHTCLGVGTKKDYRQAAAYIIDNFQDGDMIFHVDYCATLPFEHYFRLIGKDKFEELSSGNYLLVVEDGEDVVPFKFQERGAKRVKSDISVENNRRVWLVYSSFVFDTIINYDGKGEMPEEVYIRDHMEKSYIRKDARGFKEIIVYLYEKR